MSKVFLKYSFIFDPSDVWTNKEQFDLDLANYFQSKGWRAEVVNPQSQYADEVMVYLERIDTKLPIKPPPKSTVVAPGTQASQKEISLGIPSKGFDGKFKKDNK